MGHTLNPGRKMSTASAWLLLLSEAADAGSFLGSIGAGGALPWEWRFFHAVRMGGPSSTSFSHISSYGSGNACTMLSETSRTVQ